MKRVFFLHRSNLHSFRSNLMQRAKKIRGSDTPDFFALCLYLLPARSMISARVRTLRPETIATVHWPSISWLEWYLSFVSTTCTRRRVHLTLFAIVIATIISRTPIARLGFACRPASGTTARAVRQTTAGIEFLLPSGEHKLLIAIAAIQFLIGC